MSLTCAKAGLRICFDNLADHSRYYEQRSESLHHLAQIVTGHHDDVERAEPVHDPWWRHPVDPEHDRTPTTYDTGGRSG